MPHISRITVYPIKSLPGTDRQQVAVLPSGALEHDRRYALVDSEGNYVNGKRHAAILRIRANYDVKFEHVTLSLEGNQQTFSLEAQRSELANWCSEALGLTCRLEENLERGFPDDTDATGPTLLGRGSLETVFQWFSELDLGETWRRFRTNLEVSSTEPFWEDQLVTNSNQTFGIGQSRWYAHGICQRCVVPTRDSLTGEALSGFAKSLSTYRQDSLPSWSPVEKFDHFYRLAINTRLAILGDVARISVGDELSFPEGVSLD